MKNIKVVNLEPPVDHVLLFVQLHPDGWRFHSWKAALGHTISEQPPRTTLGRTFSTPDAAARFFSAVLTHPQDLVPPEPPAVPGRMPPAPQTSYYWPPSLERCIENYQGDLIAPPNRQLKIRRVIILGAGFSAAFQFSTARTIVSGVMSFFETWKHDDWYQNQHQVVGAWLSERFPEWRTDPPSLYEFLDSFFPTCSANSQRPFIEASDPVYLLDRRISWETGNLHCWIPDTRYAPNEHTYSSLRSFEALLGTYLLVGRLKSDLQTQWAENLFRNIQPTDVILTFNWDVIPEVLLVGVGTPFCHYDWTSERVKLVKLHGSADLLGEPNGTMQSDLEGNRERFECVTDKLWRARTNDDVLLRTQPGPGGRPLFPAERYNKSAVLIMPPRYPLGYGYSLIQFSWQKARTALERAAEIHIVGYSIPSEDRAFASLAGRAVHEWNDKVMVHVWNPDIVVGARAIRLFGPNRVIMHSKPASSFQLS